MKNSAYAYVVAHRAISGSELHIKSSKKAVEVSRIEVTGSPFEVLQAAESALSEIVKIRNDFSTSKGKIQKDLEDLEEEKVALNEEVIKLKAESDDAKNAINDLNVEVDSIRSTISSETSNRDKLISENRVSQNTVTQLESKIERLNKSLSQAELDLRELTGKRRLISDEFTSFVDEGRGQARVYGWISIIPAVMAAVALGFLIYGGWTFAKLVVATPTQAYAYFVQRLPYTAATVTIVGLLLEILRQIVKKIMRIHEDRLALARLLVIARDATYASATGLEMNEDQIFSERMKVKMQLLKAHLGLEPLPQSSQMDHPEIEESKNQSRRQRAPAAES